MNDFTKEELQFIWQSLAVLSCEQLKGMEDLPNKVCAMYDNYDSLSCAYVAKVGAPFDETIWNKPCHIIVSLTDE